MTNYTPAQLEAWAGLGPWEWCENWLYVATPNPPSGPVLWYTANDDGVHAEPNDAALIAAAPDLARLVLEKEKEIARLKAALKPFVDATRLADLRRLENDDVLLKLTWPSKKGHTCFANLGPCQIEAAHQAMKETND